MRQRTWLWISIVILVVTMLIGGVGLQGGGRGALGPRLLLADDGGGDSPGNPLCPAHGPCR